MSRSLPLCWLRLSVRPSDRSTGLRPPSASLFIGDQREDASPAPMKRMGSFVDARNINLESLLNSLKLAQSIGRQTASDERDASARNSARNNQQIDQREDVF